MKQAATFPIALLLCFFPTLCLSTSSSSVQIIPQSHENTTATIEQANIPTQSLYQLIAAELAIERDMPDIALANYIAAAKETKDAQVASRATQIALTVGTLEVAIVPAEIWAQAEPDNLEAQITTAALHLRLNQIDAAMPYLQKSARNNPEEAFQYYLILYRQLQDEADNQRVLQVLQKLSTLAPPVIPAQLALAEIYLYKGQNKEGLELSQQALKSDPKSVIAIQLNSEALIRSNGKEAAKQFLSKNLQTVLNNTALSQYYTQFLIEHGYEEEAKQHLKQILHNPDLSPQNLLQFARVSMQARWFDISKKILNRTKQYDETQDLSHYFLARIAEQQDQVNEAISWYEQVLTGPFHALSQLRASVLLTEQKQYQRALDILAHTQASDLNEEKQIMLSKVDVLNKSMQFQESFLILNQVIKKTPDDIEFRYARSIVATQLNKTKLAQQDLEAILTLQPNHIDALNTLGYLLISEPQQYQRAEQYLTKALALSPNNPSVLDSLGWLYYKKGDYQKALQMLQQAEKIMPDAEISAHLGEVMWKLNDFEGAKRVWNNALKQHPKHENILNAMKRLMAP